MRIVVPLLLLSALSSCRFFEDPMRAEVAYMACVGREVLALVSAEAEAAAASAGRVTAEAETGGARPTEVGDYPAEAQEAGDSAPEAGGETAEIDEGVMLSEHLRLAIARNAFDAYRDSAANHARSAADSVRYTETAQTTWLGATSGTQPEIMRAFDDRYREMYLSLGGECPAR